MSSHMSVLYCIMILAYVMFFSSNDINILYINILNACLTFSLQDVAKRPADIDHLTYQEALHSLSRILFVFLCKSHALGPW